MARLARPASPSEDGDDPSSHPRRSTTRASTRPPLPSQPSLSPSPAASFSSDKENRTSAPRGEKRKEHAKEVARSVPMSGSPATASSANKRRRLTDRDGGPLASQAVHRRQLQDANDTDFYDPDQNIDERRTVRKGIRDLAKELNGMWPAYASLDLLTDLSCRLSGRISSTRLIWPA